MYIYVNFGVVVLNCVSFLLLEISPLTSHPLHPAPLPHNTTLIAQVV